MQARQVDGEAEPAARAAAKGPQPPVAIQHRVVNVRAQRQHAPHAIQVARRRSRTAALATTGAGGARVGRQAADPVRHELVGVTIAAAERLAGQVAA